MNDERPTSVEHFERLYAQRSGVTVELLHAWGVYGQVCDCGMDGCTGFAMGQRFRHRPSS